MLACIPTNGSAGAEDSASDHFGSAAYFTLYDSIADEIKVIENRNAHHSHGTCHPMAQLSRYKIDCIVCSGMGRRAIEALQSEGIKIYQTDTKNVGEIIENIKTGNLTEIDPAKACRGHGQRMGFVDGVSGPGQGRGAGFGQGGRGRGGQASGSGRRRGRG